MNSLSSKSDHVQTKAPTKGYPLPKKQRSSKIDALMSVEKKGIPDWVIMILVVSALIGVIALVAPVDAEYARRYNQKIENWQSQAKADQSIDWIVTGKEQAQDKNIGSYYAYLLESKAKPKRSIVVCSSYGFVKVGELVKIQLQETYGEVHLSKLPKNQYFGLLIRAKK
jgi:hypothetical protein